MYIIIEYMKQTICIYAFAALLLGGCKSNNELTIPTNLRTEYLTEPIGLDTSSPRFTWEYSGNEEGFKASRYEVRIGTSPDDLRPYAEGMPLKPHTRYYWNVTVWDGEGRPCATSETASFETAKFDPSDWSASWITDHKDKEFEPAPLFRKSFPVGKEVKDARVYVASAGYHELFINGERVGTNYLDPGYTHFDKRILYVTHDVTSLLEQGDNAVAAVLGNGWYNEQSVAVWNFHEARWRNRPRLLCELRITYTDGTTEVIGSDETWKTSTGAYTYNNIYSGDKFDARLEEAGWKTAHFDDSKWEAALPAQAPAPLLVAQQMPGIRITEEVRPVSMKRFSDQLYVYSFPKNMSGLCRLKVKGEAGTRITLKHGELLKKDGRLEQGNINVYYHPVKPDEVFQMDVFTLKGTGEEEIFMPSFSYHGFQYVEVESSRPVTLTEENLTGLFMHTDVRPSGSFACSNPLLNKIWEATMQAYRSNLHSIPTDCPQREKNGWTADAHIAIDLGLLGFDGITLYEKWMNDIIDNQREAGEISGIIPSSGWGYGEWPGPVWDAVMFIIPNALYAYYGESRKANTLKSLINQKFFNAETGVYAEGTQTAQALALYLGLVPEGKEQLVADKLREVVAGNNYFLDFGLLGSKTVPAMLTKYGYIEDAMKMITKTEAPSWGYWVETMGYSTLPETWTLSPKFADASLNHVFMGDVSAWMMNQLAGINHDDSAPGFRHIRITPHFVKELDWAKGEYHSVRGRIASEWKREGDKVMLTVTIPADCSADIVVGDQTETVSAGTHTFTYPA